MACRCMNVVAGALRWKGGATELSRWEEVLRKLRSGFALMVPTIPPMFRVSMDAIRTIAIDAIIKILKLAPHRLAGNGKVARSLPKSEAEKALLRISSQRTSGR